MSCRSAFKRGPAAHHVSIILLALLSVSGMPLPAHAGSPAAGAPAKATPAKAAPAKKAKPAVTVLPPPNLTQALFAKHTVTGDDLEQVMLGLELAAADPVARAQFVGQMGPAFSGDEGGGSTDDRGVLDILKGEAEKALAGMGVRAAREAIHRNLGVDSLSFSNKMASDFIQTLTGDTDALKGQSVELPKADHLTLLQEQNLLVMAAMVIMSNISKETLRRAQEDYKQIEPEYKALLEEREAAATVLAEVLDKLRQAHEAHRELQARAMQKELDALYTPEELKFLESLEKERSLHEFGDDLGLQNLAVKYLRSKDPEKYKDYTAHRAKLVARSRAYTRTIAGVTGFGGFSLAFGKQFDSVIQAGAKQKNHRETMLALIPLTWKFSSAAARIIKAAADTLKTGLILEPSQRSLHYEMVREGSPADAQGVKDVFRTLKQNGDAKVLSDAIFRSDTPGFAYRVFQCDQSAAGELIDQAVQSDTHKRFVEGYLDLRPGDQYPFADLLSDTDKGPQEEKSRAERLLPLLSRDQRHSDESSDIRDVQNDVAANYPLWTDAELATVILANSEGWTAQMLLGSTLIRLKPSMFTIVAYENYADSCNSAAVPGGKPHKSARQHQKK